MISKQEEQVENRSGHDRGIRTGDAGEDFRDGRHERVREDRRFQYAPENQKQKGDPGHAGLKIALRHLAGHLEGQNHQLLHRFRRQIEPQPPQRKQPSGDNDDKATEADPVHPDGKGGVPPGQQQHAQQFDPARAERQRIERQMRAPDRADPQQDGQEEQEVIDSGQPTGGEASTKPISACCMSGIQESGIVRK